MELRHLRYFQAVASELHFGRAAAKLCIEPSPLSRTIKDLENELGVCLIVRNARRCILTKEGELLLKKSKDIFQILEDTKKTFAVHPEHKQKTLKISVSDEINITRFSETIRSYREQNQQFRVKIYQTTISEQLIGIENHSYDLGFCRDNSIKKNNIIIRKVWEEPLIALLPVRHPLLRYSELTIENILKYQLIYFDQKLHSGYHYQIKSICDNIAKGKQIKIAEYAKNFEMMLALVSAGYGLSLVANTKLEHMKSDMVVGRKIRNANIKSYIMYSKLNHLTFVNELLKDIAK